MRVAANQRNPDDLVVFEVPRCDDDDIRLDLAAQGGVAEKSSPTAGGGVWYYLNDNLVVDQTHLSGAWDFDLKYTARWSMSTGGTKVVSLFDAIEKLGLKLDASMAPKPVVVVDSVNRTPTPDSAEAEKAFPPSPTQFQVELV